MIIKFIPFVPHDTKIDFFGHRFYALLTSFIIIGGAIFCLSTKGLNFGVDFVGGTIMEIETPVDPDITALRTHLHGLDLGDIALQEFGGARSLMIRMPQQEGGPEAQKAAIDKVRAALDGTYGEGTVDYRRTEYVGPQVGTELKRASLIAILVSIVSIMGYIWFRFNWQYGIGAMLALIHDVMGVLGLFSLTQMPFDLATLAAILLVSGYSINETIIIFDRVRETLRKYKKMPMPDIINYSINSTLPRTIMTSGSTLLALAALWLFGGDVIRSFTSALFFGILIGTHSSYFVSSSSLYYLKLRPDPDKPGAEAESQAAS